MSNVIKFCGCKACRRHRHGVKRNKLELYLANKKIRAKAKLLLKQGNEVINTTVSICYTD